MNRSFLLALLAAASCHAVPAAAFTTPSNNNGNDSNAQANAQAVAGATANATGVGLGVGVGVGGDAVATGGHASSTVRNDLRNDLVNTNLTSDVNNVRSDNTQSQDQKQDQTQRQEIVQSGNSDQRQSQLTENANNARQSVTFTTPRSPVSSAFSTGSAGVGTCRFGPGAGFQFITTGYNVTLPVFKDRDCRTITYFNALLAAGQGEAAVQFLSARDAEVNKAVTEARKHGNN